MEVGTPAKSAAIWLLHTERIRLVEPHATADGLILDIGTDSTVLPPFEYCFITLSNRIRRGTDPEDFQQLRSSSPADSGK